jgi:ribosomal protein L11 methyltransferase
VSVEVFPEAEEAISESLRAMFGEEPTIYARAEKRASFVSVYLPGPPGRSWRSVLAAHLRELRRIGLNPGPGRTRSRRLRTRDWRDAWKRHFAPIEVGRSLLIKPGWSRRRPRRGQKTIVLDPGLSFGTGQHPTTDYCLREIARHRRTHTPQALLDVGTGSGILAIAAARLGYSPVHAIDVDPEALGSALRNARRNRVASRIRFGGVDIRAWQGWRAESYAVICANLNHDLLSETLGRLVARLLPDGWLVLAGILTRQFGDIRQAAAKARLRLVRSRIQRGWCSATFRHGW